MVGPWSMAATESPPEPVAPPRWDVTDVFPSLQSRELTAARERLGADIVRLVKLYDEHGVGEVPPHAPSDDEVAAADAVLAETNAVERQYEQLRVYVNSLVTTDSRNDAAQGLYSTLEREAATLRQLAARLAAWVAALGADALAAASPLAADHAFPLGRAAARAEHQMPGPEEALYAELSVTGSSAWARLHQDITSQLTAAVTFPDGH